MSPSIWILLILTPIVGGSTCKSKTDPSVTSKDIEKACLSQLLNVTAVRKCQFAAVSHNDEMCDIEDEEDYKAFVCRRRKTCMALFHKVFSL